MNTYQDLVEVVIKIVKKKLFPDKKKTTATVIDRHKILNASRRSYEILLKDNRWQIFLGENLIDSK